MNLTWLRKYIFQERLFPVSYTHLKKNIYIELTDISEGMISDARRNIKKATESWKERDIDVSFRFRVASCEKTGAKDESYDLVIANHVLFYCKNVNKADVYKRQALPRLAMRSVPSGALLSLELIVLRSKISSD